MSCIGITNQRETAVIWDRATLAAPRRAIVWQDRRTARICAQLREAGHEPRVTELTGLRLDPYFTGTKLTWLAEHEPATWSGPGRRLRSPSGTVDSYLIARMTGGARHVTDASNASRTLLFDIQAGQWSAELCELLRVPPRALPEVVPSTGVAAADRPGRVPRPGAADRRHRRRPAGGAVRPGLLRPRRHQVHLRHRVVRAGQHRAGRSSARRPALLSTVAWMDGAGALTYALEGSVFVTGAAVQWLRDGLGLLDDAAQSEALARSGARLRRAWCSCPR